MFTGVQGKIISKHSTLVFVNFWYGNGSVGRWGTVKVKLFPLKIKII